MLIRHLKTSVDLHLLQTMFSKSHKASCHCISVFCSSLISISGWGRVSPYSLSAVMEMRDLGQTIVLFCLFILFIMSCELLLHSSCGVHVKSQTHRSLPFQSSMNLLSENVQGIQTRYVLQLLSDTLLTFGFGSVTLISLVMSQ